MASSRLLKSLDYFFVLRPMLFFPGWSTLLAGYLIAWNGRILLPANHFMAFNYGEIALLLILFGAAMGGSFLLNQIQDIDSDRSNNKLFFLSEKHISKRAAVWEAALLIVFALTLALAIDRILFVAVGAFILITGYAYNYRPFAFKDNPVTSLLANAAMGWLAFAIGWLAQKSWSTELIFDALPYLFFNTALYFFTTLPDVEGDRANNKNTLAVTHGVAFVIYCAGGLFAVALLSAIWLSDVFALTMLVPSLPFFARAVIRRSVEAAVQSTKYGILFFAIAVCLKLPFYLLLMIAIFGFTKWFFRKRFNFNYPNFAGR